jgi:hypothetical protein
LYIYELRVLGSNSSAGDSEGTAFGYSVSEKFASTTTGKYKMAISLKAKPPTCNQAELAQMASVDRTTIRKYTQAGMPYRPGGQGKENRYIIPLCINWIAGYQSARENGLPMMSPLELILFGYTTAFQNASFQEYRSEARGIAAKAGASDQEFDEAVGFLRGAKLLPR